VASTIVQPLGIPLVPLGHDVIDAAFVNVPDEATPLTHVFTQLVDEISVARHIIELSFVHP
jgi:hypothetical protein